MTPSYLSLSEREWQKKIEKLFKILESCEICPRKCKVNPVRRVGRNLKPLPNHSFIKSSPSLLWRVPSNGVNRLKGEEGFCKLKYLPKISAFHSHFGEEKVLVGKYGSGTIFLTSCNLACVYCQNYEISQLRIGEEVSFEKLADIILELQKMGCHNINFVTPTPQVPQIVRSVYLAVKKGLKIPLVYNTSSYDLPETLKILDKIFDIYMPDVKYSDDKIALKFSQCQNYFEIMKRAVKEMHSQVGDLILDKEGIAKRGLLVRHLVLPNNLAGSEKIFQFLAKEISKNTFLNIMDQYYPTFRAFEYPEISRRITEDEFKRAISLAKKFGLKRIYY